MKIRFVFPLLWIMATAAVHAQQPDSTNHWGYGYDSLLRDLGTWRKSPFAKVDSIGASGEGRSIWMVTITGPGDSLTAAGGHRKRRVFIHVRTHPAEVQVEYVANEAVRFLLDTGALAADIRNRFIFNIIPMYNPDGVEDGHSRTNGHRVDLESNWDKPVLEPEVKVLRGEFESLMAGPIPIEVALNLHSDQFNCTRFFFFHEVAGTSSAYAVLEKDYIAKVRAYFPVGIEDWFFVQSWGDGTQARYPEGYWWLNHHENVLALTYEDANCPGAGKFDSTARALVLGSVDYIKSHPVATVPVIAARRFRLSPRDGGWLLSTEAGGARDAGARLEWALVDAAGRLLSTGVLNGGAGFIPRGQLPFRPAWLLLNPGGASRRDASPMEAYPL